MRGVFAIAAVLAAVLSCVSSATPARAHATLVSSEPADGAVIPAAPSRLVLTFNEPVSPLVLRLVAPDGNAAAVQAAATGGSALAVVLPSAMAQGTHVLSWRVVSLDGHPVGGTVVFSIGAPSSAAPAAASSGDGPVRVALWACKIILYVALFVGCGGAFFCAWVARGMARPPAVTAALVAGLVAAPLAVGLQGADALGTSLDELASGIVWRTGFETSFGATAVAAVAALLAGLFSLAIATRALSLAALFGVGLALALSGHASAASPQALMRSAVFAHAVALAFWIGALVPLAACLRAPNAAALARFSTAIPWAIALLIASGAVLAVVQVEQPALLLTTDYGRLLCAKLVLVALLLTLAAWNRVRLTSAVAAGDNAARQTLRRAIGIELAIVVIVFGMVAAWRFTPPPRALALAASRPAHLHIHTVEAMVDVTFKPGHAGPVQAEIIIMKGDFSGLDAKEVRLTLENKAAGIEAISRPATKGADAIWRVEQFPVPRDGAWDVQVDILVNDFEKTQLSGEIAFGAR